MKQIPKIWHLIWIGSALPDEYKKNIRAILQHNPDYEFRLYIDSATLPLTPKTVDEQGIPTDPDVPSLAIPAIEKFCQNPLDDASQRITLIDLDNPSVELTFAEECKKFVAQPFYNDWVCGQDKNLTFAVDVVRLAILYAFGGVYSDLDCISKKPIGTLSNETGMFFCGEEIEYSIDHEQKKQIVGDNWFIASVPKNQIFLEILYKYYIGYRNLILEGKSLPLGKSPYEIPNDAQQKSAVEESKEYDAAYMNYRKTSPCNIGVKLGCFGFPTTVKVFKGELEKNFGELGLKQSLFPMQSFLTHYESKSWWVTHVQDNTEDAVSAMNKELFRLRGGM